MKRPEEFENILDECLEMVFGGESIEACLEKHPDHAVELKPLLETIGDTTSAVDIKPRAEFKRQAFYDFQKAVRELPEPGTSGFFTVFRHWWVTTAAVLAVIVFGGGGTVFAAQSSQPDSFLYPVKLATESARIALAFSDEGKTELYAQFTERRVDEMVVMAEQGNAVAVNKAVENLDRQLVAMVDVVSIDNADTAMPESAAMFSQAADEPPVDPAAPDPALPDTDPQVAGMSATDTKASLTDTETGTIAVPQPVSPVTPVPNIIVTQPPATTIVVAPAQEESGGILRGIFGLSKGQLSPEDEAARFRMDIIGQAAGTIQKLEAALETATGEVRESLEAALARLHESYDEVFRNIR